MSTEPAERAIARMGAFPKACEDWLYDFTSDLLQAASDLLQAAKDARPGIAVTHNIGPGTQGWYAGQKIAFSNLDTFASGDINGGRDEQLLISKLHSTWDNSNQRNS